MEKLELKTIEDMFDSGSESSPDDNVKGKLEMKADTKVAQVKQKLWEEKNEELIGFKSKLVKSHKHELDRVLEVCFIHFLRFFWV